MRWEQSIQYGSISDIGFRRRNNQDSLAVHICSDEETWRQRGHLFLVADGMGGHAVGELASKIAADTLPHTYFKSKDTSATEALKKAVEVGNRAIFERGSHNRDFERMGTTCSTLVLSPEGALIGHVGDSRVYRVRNNQIDQLSFDHSLQWELLKQGKMKPEDVFLHEPRHVITRSLGPEETVEVDIEGPYPIFPGDIYVLCSDGLTSHVNDAEIGMIVSELPPGDSCRLLTHLANLRGGSDNITVVVCRVGDTPEGLPSGRSDSEPKSEGGLNWTWLGAFWLIAAVFGLGICLTLMDWVITGISIATSAVVFVAGLLGYWLRQRPSAVVDSDETVLWRPYRTASAKLSKRFLNHLAAIEAELQRTASEEGWTIDWATHESSFQSAQTALGNRQYSQSFIAYSRTIDILMAGLQLYRKQLKHEAQWGRHNSKAERTNTALNNSSDSRPSLKNPPVDNSGN